MAERPSFHLKLDRAARHLKELKAEIARYDEIRPYEALRVRQKQRYPKTVDFTAHLREEPSPDIALIAGDAVHNIRASLDHLVNSLVPNRRKGKAQFPVRLKKPWRTDEAGVDVFDDPCDQWLSHTKGIPEQAFAHIERLQPYNSADPPRTELAILSSLDNHDKHRKLAVVILGLRNASTFLNSPDGNAMFGQAVIGDVQDGAVVASFPIRDSRAEMDVHIHGAVHVAVEVAGANHERLPLPDGLQALLDFVRQEVVAPLEPFVKVQRRSGAGAP